MTAWKYRCKALLFDLDGVLVDSIGCTERAWRMWAQSRHVDIATALRVSHGRPVRDTLGLLAPQLDPATEAAYLDAIEAHETSDVHEAPGAQALLRQLPPGTWAIVTSATRRVAELRLRHTGLPMPDVLVAADDIARGKPDPEGYLAAAARLGVAPSDCVVVEDAAAGIQAAHAARMPAVAIASTRPPEELAGADVLCRALQDLQVQSDQRDLRVSAEPRR